MKSVTFGYATTFYFKSTTKKEKTFNRLEYFDKLLTKLKNEILLGYLFDPEHRNFIKKYITSQEKKEAK